MKENLDSEVDDFRKFWGGDILLDSDMALYKALGGGAVHQPYGLGSFLLSMVNPFSSARFKKHLNNAKDTKGNLKGEGFITGGTMVLNSDVSVQYSFLEEDIGDSAPMTDVMAALSKAK